MQNKFPDNFLFGAATSAHQVEGGNHNDWTEWEKKNADRLSLEAKKKWQPWQQEKFPEMFEIQNYISENAANHYNLYEKDFDIAKQLGHNAHRFSIEWSRVEPTEGEFDEKEIEHYRQVLRALRARKLEPFVTLWHWTLPSWLRDKGGVRSKEFAKYFERYSEYVVRKLGEDIKFLITINEPIVYSWMSYWKGYWPPNKRDIFSFIVVVRHLFEAHRSSYLAIKKIDPKFQLGIASNNIDFDVHRAKGPKLIIQWHRSLFWNHYFIKKIENYQDFIGLNYYFHHHLRREKKIEARSDLGWAIYSRGIFHMIMDLKRYNLPIYITENGIADAGDTQRKAFIQRSLKWLKKGLSEGADVRGYFYWSLLDNFEWSEGFWPRFGLVEIDYETMERKIRPSAWEYKKIIEEGI